MILIRCSYLLILAGFFTGCGTTTDATFPVRQDVSESVYASGVVKARFQYEAYANTSGVVQQLFVKEGDSVKAGDPILSIYNESARIGRETAELNRSFADRRQNRTRLENLEVNIGLARSKRQNDSVLFERQQALFAQNVGTRVELEQRQLALESARTAYQSARLQYEDVKREIEFNERSAAKNLTLSRALEGDLVLKSNVDGRVYSVLREKGEIVNPQIPLAVIGSDKEFILELRVDEYDIARIVKGQRVLVKMDSHRGQSFEAIVSRIYPIMDERNKTFVVEAVFTSGPAVLYPNLSLEANIVIQTRTNALTIPRSYLYKDQFVVTKNKDTLTVKVGLKDYKKVEILDGIDEKTQLIEPGE